MDDRRHRSAYVASVVVVRPPAHAAPRQAPPRTALPPVAGRYVLLDQVGAGGMGRAWLRNIKQNPDVVLAGLVDLDVPLARAAAGGADSSKEAICTACRELRRASPSGRQTRWTSWSRSACQSCQHSTSLRRAEA